jgi:hypothetical protein
MQQIAESPSIDTHQHGVFKTVLQTLSEFRVIFPKDAQLFAAIDQAAVHTRPPVSRGVDGSRAGGAAH